MITQYREGCRQLDESGGPAGNGELHQARPRLSFSFCGCFHSSEDLPLSCGTLLWADAQSLMRPAWLCTRDVCLQKCFACDHSLSLV